MTTQTPLLAERYRLLRMLGSGGLGEVWLADDLSTGERVAVKLLRRERSPLAPQLGNRSARHEIVAGERLQHPQIVRVLDNGAVDGDPYLVLEYVQGQSLREALNERGRLPIEEVTAIGTEVAAALAHAHAQGVLHNDIKPENILLGSDGAKLTDFGAAQGVSSTLSVTGANQFEGTIAYLAPEVLQGGSPSAASDIYALGLVLFEAAAGERPWAGANAAAIAGQRLLSGPPPLRSFVPDAPPELEAALDRALQPAAVARYPSAAAFRAALAGRSEPTVLITRPIAASAPAAVSPASRRRPGPIILACILAVALLGGVAFAIASRADGDGADAFLREQTPVASAATAAATPTEIPPTATTAPVTPAGAAIPPTVTPVPPQINPPVIVPGNGKKDGPQGNAGGNGKKPKDSR